MGSLSFCFFCGVFFGLILVLKSDSFLLSVLQTTGLNCLFCHVLLCAVWMTWGGPRLPAIQGRPFFLVDLRADGMTFTHVFERKNSGT